MSWPRGGEGGNVRSVSRGLCVLMLLFGGALAAAETIQKPVLQPFATFNQFQFLQIYGLPVFRSYEVLPEGTRSSDFAFDLTNHLDIGTDDPNEQFIVDGELLHATLIFRQGFGNDMEWALEVPILRHSGGFLDGPIDRFHDIFGFDRGRRARTEDDRLLYLYQRNGRTLFRMDDNAAGLGDIRLVLTKELSNVDGRGSSISGLIKAPTGDPDKLTGSGGADAALWYTWGAQPRDGSRWSWLATLGGIYTSRGDVLEELRRRGAGFGSFTLGWRWTDTVQLKGQLYAHSPLYEDSELDPLKEVAVLAVIGGGWQVTPTIDLDFGLVEDLNAGASADVSLHFAIRRRIWGFRS